MKDSTETEEVDRIWLNLIKSSREVRVNQAKSMNGEAGDLDKHKGNSISSWVW